MQNTADKIKKRDKPNDVFYTPIPLVKNSSRVYSR